MVKEKEQPSKPKKLPPTMKITAERDIAMDFATKLYKEFDQMIKSVVIFGSSAKKISTPDSDIDIIVVIDDVAIQWDAELVAHYRDTLASIIKTNPYKKSLHINTVKLSTWWQDLMRGDPIIVNILRYGDALIDFGGFFNPLKILLKDGLIKSTPESIYTLLQRAPNHIARARTSMLAAVDGLYWACVDSAHAALITAKIKPASPEQIPEILTNTFVKNNLLNKKFVKHYAELHELAKEIIRGKITEVKGKEIDDLYSKTDEFVGEMANLVDKLIDPQ
ncbi:hypothetical protein CMI37_16350 [Candidatus Pacearchaeota archaeon]|nr:hypothetical protein [Candidatus Pacearchaeota archaeon]